MPLPQLARKVMIIAIANHFELRLPPGHNMYARIDRQTCKRKTIRKLINSLDLFNYGDLDSKSIKAVPFCLTDLFDKYSKILIAKRDSCRPYYNPASSGGGNCTYL